MKKRQQTGFTLIEIMISLGVLGILSLIIATILLRTVDTYGQLSTETDTLKRARHCLEMISREMRESVNYDIALAAGAGPVAAVQNDALLLTSARRSDGLFLVDVDNFPDAESIILFYLNTTAEGIPQLVRLQLYYTQDLNAFTEPFVLGANPYQGANIILNDNGGVVPFNVVTINRATGAVGGTPPLLAPKIMMNQTVSLDLMDNGIDPIEARIACQVIDRHGRTATTRLSTQIDPRNF